MIANLRIKNFKSIGDLNLDCRRVNLFFIEIAKILLVESTDYFNLKPSSSGVGVF